MYATSAMCNWCYCTTSESAKTTTYC